MCVCVKSDNVRNKKQLVSFIFDFLFIIIYMYNKKFLKLLIYNIFRDRIFSIVYRTTCWSIDRVLIWEATIYWWWGVLIFKINSIFRLHATLFNNVEFIIVFLEWPQHMSHFSASTTTTSSNSVPETSFYPIKFHYSRKR